ncbi:hypothetical protein R3F64_01475 [Halomonas sp. 5021]|uniref:hypothetical protein n=1 Tax=Halomonas sp. 5021 TaxID=3082156 RepID=UPI002FC876B9
MNGKTLSVIAILGLVTAMAWAGNADYEATQREHLRYCERVAQYEAEVARGVPTEKLNGHSDFKNVAEEHCPGLRPAR